MPRSSILYPSLAIATAGFMWGLWWLPLRSIEASGLSGDWASVVLYVLATGLTAPVALWRWRRFRDGGVDLVGIGLLSGAAFALWNHSLIDGNVVRVTLLFYLAPVWATALNFVVFREPLRLLRALSIMLGLGGAAIVLGIESGLESPLSLADWFALASGMCFAVGAIWTRRVPQVDGFAKTVAALILAAPVALVLALLLPNGAAPTVAILWNALPMALLCMIWLIPLMWMILWGASHVDAGRVAILLLLEIVAAVVSAALLTDEPFGWREVTGCLLILAAGLLEGMSEMRRAAPAGSATGDAEPLRMRSSS